MASLDIPPLGWIVLLGVAFGVLVVEPQLRATSAAPRGTTFLALGAAAPFAFLGCKAAGALDDLDAFERDPLAFLSSSGRAASWGGLVLGGIVAAVVLRVDAASFFDAAVPGVLVAYAIGRVGCHVTADGCHGVATDSAFGCIYPGRSAPGERVHPTALYEAAFAAAFLVVLGALAPRMRALGGGALFAVYLVGHWGFRFAVECLRTNPRHAGLSAAQWASLALVLLGVALLASRARRARRESPVLPSADSFDRLASQSTVVIGASPPGERAAVVAVPGRHPRAGREMS